MKKQRKIRKKTDRQSSVPRSEISKAFKELEEKIRKIDIPIPIYDTQIFGLSIWIWKEFHKPELEIVETYPYEPDGTTPLIFARCGWVELVFENKMLYKFLYKRKHGYYPMALETE